ncbi:hypothetical protein Tco_1477380 [Tanacetum coccineum]
MGGGTTGLDESLLYIVDVEYGCGFKMETEEPVSKNAIIGIGLAYASVRRYLSSLAVPRRFPVLSNSARNFF